MDNCGYFSAISEKIIIYSVAANSVRHITNNFILNCTLSIVHQSKGREFMSQTVTYIQTYIKF